MDDMCRAGMTSQRGVRFWEEKGLLGDVDRSDAGQRRFTAAQIRLARIIAAAQYCSFSLDDIKAMLADYDDEAFQAIQHKLAAVAATALALGEGLPKPVAVVEYDL
jgi:MerR family gold-responsive transcriptional activator of gol and ges genes